MPNHPRILVVEDETFIASWIEDTLRSAGYIVAVASQLDRALSLATKLELEAAVLDINLRGELSYPVAEVLRRRGIPFAVCTAYRVKNVPAVLRDAPFINKPIDEERLVAAMAEMLGRQREYPN